MYHRAWKYLIIFTLVFYSMPLAVVPAEKPEKKSDRQKLLEKYANDLECFGWVNDKFQFKCPSPIDIIVSAVQRPEPSIPLIFLHY